MDECLYFSVKEAVCLSACVITDLSPDVGNCYHFSFLLSMKRMGFFALALSPFLFDLFHFLSCIDHSFITASTFLLLLTFTCLCHPPPVHIIMAGHRRLMCYCISFPIFLSLCPTIFKVLFCIIFTYKGHFPQNTALFILCSNVLLHVFQPCYPHCKKKKKSVKNVSSPIIIAQVKHNSPLTHVMHVRQKAGCWL